MNNIENISNALFNKIRGRFPSVTLGDESGKPTTDPDQARFYDFEYTDNSVSYGNVSVSLTDTSVAVMYSTAITAEMTQSERQGWFSFLKELRRFTKKQLLNFDVRNINKSQLQKRDYRFLTKTQRDSTMNEATKYKSKRVSEQTIDNAKLIIVHSAPIDRDQSRTWSNKIESIYIESSTGERFKYPNKSLTGARAMARHVAEGGIQYDDFGKHIIQLGEEMNKLRKFNRYLARSAVMAENLSQYSTLVVERIAEIKKTLTQLQRPGAYKQAVESYVAPTAVEVPNSVRENWIDELTVKQFNEELADIFPYVYKLVSEASRVVELTADNLIDEAVAKIACLECDTVSTAAAWAKNNNFCPACETSNKGVAEGTDLEEADTLASGADDPCWNGYKMVGTKKHNGKQVPNCVPEELALEAAFEQSMGQFAEQTSNTQLYLQPFVSNFYSGKYYQSGIDSMFVLASSPEEATAIAKEHINAALEHFKSKRYRKGSGSIPALRKDETNIKVSSLAKPSAQQSHNKVLTASGTVGPVDLARLEEAEATPGSSNIDVNKIEVGDLIKVRDIDWWLVVHDTEHNTVWAHYDWEDAVTGTDIRAAADEIIDFKKGPRHNKPAESAPEAAFEQSIGQPGNEQQTAKNPTGKYSSYSAWQQAAREVGANKFYTYNSNDDLVLDDPEGEWEGDQDAYELAVVFKGKPLRVVGKWDWVEMQGEVFAATTEAVVTEDTDIPLSEFILSHFDRETRQFPKGETAVLTMVGKQYGDKYVEPAREFIEKISNVAQPCAQADELNDIKRLSGL